MIDTLAALHADIDIRVQAIRDAHPQWLCSKGCDGCCRHLSRLPQLTAAEWALLQQGLAALPAQQLASIRTAVAAHGDRPGAPVVCPLLDQASGSCPVYAQRPVACRSYGFYVQRDLGLHCPDIAAQVAAGTLADVVWGNHDAIDHRLAGLGESRPLDAWFAAWPTAADRATATADPEPRQSGRG